MTEHANNQKHRPLPQTLVASMIWCLALALYWVTFIWGFWSREFYALGLNASLFWGLALALFLWTLYRKGYYRRSDLAWIAPLYLITLSYVLYENPFVKGVSFLVYPLLCVLFINYGFLHDKTKRFWDLNFVFHFLTRFFAFLAKINQAVTHYFDMLIPAGRRKRTVAKKIFIGVGLFLLIAVTMVIPLLSSADSVFAARMDAVYAWINSFLSVTFIYKALVFVILSLLLLSTLLAWGRRFDYKEKEGGGKPIDPIVSGIVIGGILGLYLLFLWVQLERLWVGSLPFAFSETENLVKSGFWQLFFLSIINIAIYFFTYRKTISSVQKILAAFTIASLLLLVSAAHRMALYVIYYGFSYEKFFASYTVLFCGILFIRLIIWLFTSGRADIIKFTAFLFLWMFSLVSIFPVEQFIFRANIHLAQRPDSRIRLFEMTMLSPDVLSLVKKYNAAGRLAEPVDYLEREGSGNHERTFDWDPWIEKQEQRLADKAWYEGNITGWLSGSGSR